MLCANKIHVILINEKISDLSSLSKKRLSLCQLVKAFYSLNNCIEKNRYDIFVFYTIAACNCTIAV